MGVINVGVGEMEGAAAPAIIRTILGSCVGIMLYDPQRQVGGLAHILLPLMRNGDTRVAKYANSAIPALVANLVQSHGASRNRLEAKLAGGATMFGFKKQKMQMLDIGNNNIRASRLCLEKLAIPIRAEDVGADYGRRVEFDLATGRVSIRAQGQPDHAL